MSLSFELDDAEKSFLGRQARLAIESSLPGNGAGGRLEPDGDSVLNRHLGSFVTLSIKGALRGCIGTIIGREPLYLNVWNMARAAAFHDPRFPPLAKDEWPLVDMDISVLDQPSPCPDPERIVIGRDGLILRLHGHSGVFLPQVPVEQGWNVRQYLENLCVKAGLPLGSWRDPEARLDWYQALVFPA